MANSVTRQSAANASLLEYASKHKKEEFFCDITITAGKKSIATNRLVLSCYSEFFEKKLKMKSKLGETYEQTIEIQTVSGETLTALIDFIYTGSITINNHNVMRLLSGAHYLQLHEVKQFCFEFLQQNVTSDNALQILKAATLYRNNALNDEIQQYISANLDEVAQTNDFKALSSEHLQARIINLNTNLVGTTSIYNAILTWTLHNKEARKTEFAELFKLINLNDISIDFLEEFVLEEELVITSFDCQKLALSTYHKQLVKEKTRLQASKLLCLGGKNKETQGKVKVVYDLLEDTTVDYPDLPEQLHCHNSLKLNDYIYCIGGFIKHKDKYVATNKVWKLNPMKPNTVWEQVASMNVKRDELGAAVYYDTLIVVGGSDKSSNQLDSSEFYQASLNKWKIITPMNHRRSELAVVTVDGYLYALGGYNNEDKYLSSVERLDDLTATYWETVQPMQTPRRWFASVNCDGKIYAIGGKSDEKCTRLKTAEVYSPALNQWKYISSMNIERSSHAACVLQGKIYVVGGLGKEGTTIKIIECYSPMNDTWKIVTNISCYLYKHSLVAL